MSVARPFATNPRLSAIAMGYRNNEMIADIVLPRVTVPAEQFKYTVHGQEHFNITDDTVGRTGRTNEVEFTATQTDGSVEDHGLEDPIPQSDINAAASGESNFDPLGTATLKLRKLISINREVRAAGLVFAAGTYPSGRKVQLSGTDQWDDLANSDPITDIMTGKDALLLQPNIMVIGYGAFSWLRRHPEIAKAVHGNSGDSDIVSRQAIAALFELDQVIVGSGWKNTAVKGQTQALGRIWGNHCALLHVEPTPTSPDDITFGITAQYGDYLAGDWEDPNIGLRGGRRVRVGESVRELVLASSLGYFIEDCV